MRMVSCDMLTSDMVLAKDVYKGSRVYLTAGQTHLLRYIRGLRRLGVEYLYVNDRWSDGVEIPDAITEETRQQCRNVVRDTLDKFSKDSVVETQSLMGPIRNLMNEILGNRDVHISLTDIRTTDDYTFAHSVSTTVYALVIAREMGMTESDMQMLAVGSLLHDLGKTCIDQRILNKKDRLTDKEFDVIKQHTVLGYDALSRCSTIGEAARQVALTHHERLDGTGYPNQLKGAQLSLFAKISAVADVYDALTSDRSYRRKWSAQHAVNYLIENCGTMFDKEIVTCFIHNIAIYPNGTMVQLSDGSTALVKEQSVSMPERPIVRVIYNADGEPIEPYEVDLMQQWNLVIARGQAELDNWLVPHNRNESIKPQIGIQEIDLSKEYVIRLTLNNGKKIEYDISNDLEKARFNNLTDESLFHKGYLENSQMIRWDAVTELSIAEIMERQEK